MTSAAEQLKSKGVVILNEFVPAFRCELILEELEFAFWTPSTVVRQTQTGSVVTELSSGRVSESTGEEWFGPDLRRQVLQIEARLCRRLRLNRTHVEPWQATRYRRGGKFEAHFDGGLFHDEPAGEREVTLLVYLNTLEAGGSTTFPNLGLDVSPRAGTVVAWRNLTADGTVDAQMKHAARPVRKGRKVTLTTWSRQQPIRSSTRGRTRE